MMNAYKINDTGYLANGSMAMENFTANAIFSSTIKYLQFPTNLKNRILDYILYDKANDTI
jgi:hypothetical protein